MDRPTWIEHTKHMNQVNHHHCLGIYSFTVPRPCLPLFDQKPALINLLHTLCNHGNYLTPLVVGQRCATSSFLQASPSTFAQSCRNRVSGDGGNNIVQNQTSSTANMMTLNSHCAVQCVEAIKLRLVFLKQIEMYHTSVVLSFIGYALERYSGSIADYFLKLMLNI